MLKSSVKTKRLKDGNIYREKKEHYLRKEIPCGVKGCNQCQAYPNIEVIDPQNEGLSTVYTPLHILIPTSDTLISQIDFFENELITNVVVLQTVMKRIQNKNIGVFRRLQAILKIQEKSFYLFHNEFHIDTFVTQSFGENEKEWEHRLFCIAVSWFTFHAKQNYDHISVISLFQTDPPTFDFVTAVSIFDYAKSLVLYDDLVDLLVNDDIQSSLLESGFTSEVLFDEHKPISHINSGIKSGKYLSGIFYQNPDDYMSGTVAVRNTQLSYNILGIRNINRAFTGDLVAIELLKSIPCIDFAIRVDEGSDLNIPPISDTKEVDPDQRFCKIVGIIRRNWKQYCGIVCKQTDVENYYIFRPMDTRIPLIIFESKRKTVLDRSKFCISVDSWCVNCRYPRGHVVKILGDIDDLNTEAESILFERRVPYSKFSKSVLDCLPIVGNNVSRLNLPEWRVDEVLKKEPDRVDLRHLNICSIDPPGCTDIDDALHVRRLKNDKNVYEVGIHIADVTHFVLPGTAIDKEAYRRGTTVYLVDRRVDMLPELLSSNLCSLRPNEDRLAFSVLLYVDSEGNSCSRPTKFVKSVIRSRRAFTYNEAQALIDDPKDNSETSKSLRKLLELTKIFRAKRLAKGAVSFDSPQLQTELGSETNDPITLKVKELLDTNKLVEECMLLANIHVAKKIFEKFPHLALLRAHSFPDPDKINELYTMINKRFGFNYSLDTIRLNEMLELTKSASDPSINNVVKLLSILCLKQAIYLCAGNQSYEKFYHFGLAEEMYTHFTSPIRRYPDIMVHRLLFSSISDSSTRYETIYNSDIVQQMCEHLNRCHVSAQMAGRESTKLFLYTYLKNKKDGIEPTDANVTKMFPNAISVYLPNYHHFGYIKFDPELCKKYGTVVDLQNGVIVNSKTNTCINILNNVNVQVKIAQDAFSFGCIKIDLLSPLIPGISKKL